MNPRSLSICRNSDKISKHFFWACITFFRIRLYVMILQTCPPFCLPCFFGLFKMIPVICSPDGNSSVGPLITTMEKGMTNFSIKIYGNLKETGIRFSAMHQAYKLGLYGIARFMKEDAVFIEAEGEAENIEQFKKWCCLAAEKNGKRKSEMVSKKKLKGYTEFNIVD